MSDDEIKQAINDEKDVRKRIFLENYLCCHKKMDYLNDLLGTWNGTNGKYSWMKASDVHDDIIRTEGILSRHEPRVDKYVAHQQAIAYKHLSYWINEKTSVDDFHSLSGKRQIVGDNLIENSFVRAIFYVGSGFMNVVSYVTKKCISVYFNDSKWCFYAGFALRGKKNILDFDILPYNQMNVELSCETKPVCHDSIGKAKLGDYSYDVKDGFVLPGYVDEANYRSAKTETIYKMVIPEFGFEIYSFFRKRICYFGMLLRELGANVRSSIPSDVTMIFLNEGDGLHSINL